MSTESSLVITRIYPASAAKVFAAWTEANQLKQWFCPSDDMSVPVAEVDAREGGQFRIVMQNKDGETFSPGGTYEVVIPNEKLVFSWKWADSDLVTKITLDLEALGPNQTELTLTHEGFPESSVRDLHNEGWNGCLGRLDKYYN